MGLLRKLFSLWKKKRAAKEAPKEAEQKSFFLYMARIPQILTYFRREKGVARRDLELTLIDNEEQPAYRIAEIAELAMTDLNLMYIVTARPEEFTDLADEAMKEYGLLLIVLSKGSKEKMPGNLVLDLRDWENQLDIISALSYNTLTI